MKNKTFSWPVSIIATLTHTVTIAFITPVSHFQQLILNKSHQPHPTPSFIYIYIYFYQRLFHQHTEENGISNFSETLEHFCPEVWVLDQVIQLGLEVHQYTCIKNTHALNQ